MKRYKYGKSKVPGGENPRKLETCEKVKMLHKEEAGLDKLNRHHWHHKECDLSTVSFVPTTEMQLLNELKSWINDDLHQ